MSDLIGFYTLENTKDGKGYIGAILITDKIGIPQEFRVTHPIKPTILQRQLYGNSLIEYIGVTLCGVPLFNSLRSKPEIIIVSQKPFLQLGIEVNCFVGYLQIISETFVLGGFAEASTKITPENENYKPLIVSFPKEYDDSKKQEGIEHIKQFSNSIELLEPFKRIGTALLALADQDKNFN
jgi:hypothetical protein